MTSKNRTVASHSTLPADALTGTQLVESEAIDQGHLDKSIGLGDVELSIEDLRDSLNAKVSASVDDPVFRDHVDNLAFMEERVLVRVAPSSNQDDPKIVEVWNGGTPQRMVRGEWTIVRRKYVEVLARSKPFNVTTPEYTDAKGDRATKIDTHNATLYPFEMRDKNPLGMAWLGRILSES